MNNPFREINDENAVRIRLAQAEADIAALRSPLRRTLWAGWRWLGWALLVCLGLAVVVVPFRYYVFRGTVWGVVARNNAEREALRWAKARWPATTADRIYCGGHGPCVVRSPSEERWLVSCDDDALGYNDGCQTGRPATPAESP